MYPTKGAEAREKGKRTMSELDVSPDPKDKEPIVPRMVVVGFIGGVIELLLAFGIDLTAEQIGAIHAIGVPVVLIGLAWWLRGKVFSPATVFKIMASMRRQ